ncbi:hypothetical protein ES288_A11G218300v1 [Gossypium darwinii]|uniref:Uncharacterized protein n=1 Tax=Gossypium darwinii TaxID=34276 RepID=A0A5D2ENY9_GOSDA|nr:hypothetical protein ES288_A11G218300v1 [Gossypium darwinii]
MLTVNRVINRARASISNCQYLLSHDPKISPSPPQHLASKSSIRFFDIYKLASKEKMEKERARLADELNRIARENKILIPRIAARKFPAMDVIYSNGRKSKLSIIFDASGVDVSKLAVPEASLVCLSFRANSQVCKPFYDVLSKSSDGANNALQRHIVYSFGDHYYFRKELKILNLLTGLKLCAYQYPIDIPCGYFWLAWSSLVLIPKACWLNRMSKFTVLRDLNFVVENLVVEFFKGTVVA